MRKMIISMLAFPFAMGVLAQTKVEGEATVDAGYGETAPYSGGVNMKINTGKFTIKPYFNVKCITHYNSTELNSMDLIYTGSGNHFTQEQETWQDGVRLKYGTDVQFRLDKRNIFQASVDGVYTEKTIGGERTEFLFNPDGTLISSVKSTLSSPRLGNNEIKVQTSYLHKTQLEGEQYMLKYIYELEQENEDIRQELSEKEGFDKYSLSHITGDIDIHNHEVLFDWKRPLAYKQTLNVGARYNHRYIISDDAQYLDGKEWYDEVFRHRMQTVAVYAGYNLRSYVWESNAWEADARIEYNYTRMQEKNLNDVIPQAKLVYHFNPFHSLTASYAMRIVRPTLSYLVGCHTVSPYAEKYGNEELEGTHINRMALTYNMLAHNVIFTATVAHINVTDGFNAIWFVKDNVRHYTWGNEGVRKAVEITPEVQWIAATGTKVKAAFTALWDERIAYAINLRNPNWGFTGKAGLEQGLPCGIQLGVNAMISKGNTVDVYSHEGLNYTFGANVMRSFLDSKLTATLGYEYKKLPVIEITQGAYTGSIYARHHNPNTVKLALSYKF
jgi:hypothetical protein